MILFTHQMAATAAFYRDVIGLDPVEETSGWKEYRAGGRAIALHNGASTVGTRPPKLVFRADDVEAARTALVRRGAAMGKVKSGGGVDLCEGKDPDGNPFQIANRA